MDEFYPSRERAAQGYREGRRTLSEAAGMAGMTLWEMQSYLVERGYTSSYGLEDLGREVELLDPDAG